MTRGPIWWSSTFTGHSYDSFARAYIENGQLEIGRALLVERTDIAATRDMRNAAFGEGDKNTRRIRPVWRAFRNYPFTFLFPYFRSWAEAKELAGAAWCSTKVLVRSMGALIQGAAILFYRMFFRYGMSTRRALLTMVFFLAIGIIGTNIARTGKVLELGDPRLDKYTPPPPEIALVKAMEPPPTMHLSVPDLALGSGQTELPCPIDSLSYTIDLFIPLIDLNQETQCEIRDDPHPGDGFNPYRGWRVARLIYELFGWIVTSLMVLTISGVIRRDIDR